MVWVGNCLCECWPNNGKRRKRQFSNRLLNIYVSQNLINVLSCQNHKKNATNWNMCIGWIEVTASHGHGFFWTTWLLPELLDSSRRIWYAHLLTQKQKKDSVRLRNFYLNCLLANVFFRRSFNATRLTKPPRKILKC